MTQLLTPKLLILGSLTNTENPQISQNEFSKERTG